ncbi:MAG: helix-turn-helix transcriptional regulator [Patescibacteria group bacterium]|nr:helix-turn-helix transcriptional regulator [Patescibacteria group bacterium]
MNVGYVIKAYRESERYGVRAFAKIIGISSATLSRIERGNACDSVVLAKILKWMLK